MPDFVDIHCHPNFPQYDSDRSELLEKMKEEKVWGICVGTDKKTSKESVELADKNNHLFASIGLHPTHAEEDFDNDYYGELAKNPKVVAVGECGLDYFRKDGTGEEKELQKEIFKKHVEFAISRNLPLMIHCRPSAGSQDAYEDVLEILSEYKEEGIRGNIHFFVGNLEIAKKFLDLDFTMSFTGVITFTEDYHEVIRLLPLERIMSETDAPFVAPKAYRGQRNSPLYVKDVVSEIAQIKELPKEEVREALKNNAIRYFDLI